MHRITSSAKEAPTPAKPAKSPLAYNAEYALNAVCPYFTMFPLEFPLAVLRSAPRNAFVADPFCGRGTTIYAARYLGLKSLGIDSSPIAVAIAQAKAVSSTLGRVVRLAESLLQETRNPVIPDSEFWRRAYHTETLNELCRLRDGLAVCSETQTSILLRAILLGVLHGPKSKASDRAGYLSNQMPRTFAPKPDYATRYWRSKRLKPPHLRSINVIRRKAERVLKFIPPKASSVSLVRCGDSREAESYRYLSRKISHVVTSPPYYGVRTYMEDQWIRHWFLGGPDRTAYGGATQLSHESPEAFADSLAMVWDRVAERSSPSLQMVVRFGSINSRVSDPREILRRSLQHSSAKWRIRKIQPAGGYRSGRRQADQMILSTSASPEFDFYITRQ
jgi:hypothetical protein